MHTIDSWEGCYPSNWKGVIIPEAMAHPAKYSSRLIKRIYEHMFQEKWLSKGDRVLDPFGGVSLGALDAMRLGLNWTGNELEQKFHRLGQGMDCPGFDKKYWRRYQKRGGKWNELNICPDCGNVLNDPGEPQSFFGVYQRIIPERRAHRFNGNIETWKLQCSTGDAVLLHGDSRHLLEMVQRAEAAISSPPYSDVMSKNNGGNRDQTIPSIGTGGAIPPRLYGESAGNLGNMGDGGFEAALSSPPYAETDLSYRKNGLKVEGKDHYERPYMEGQDDHYGPTPGQLGAMKGDGFQGAVSSPPYNPPMSQEHNGSRGGARGTTPSEPGAFVKYGNTPGQLEGLSMDGFEAAISSPPYADISQSGGTEGLKKHGTGLTQDEACFAEYGGADGQLGKMKAEGFDAAISSPPFLQSEGGTPEPKPGGTIDAALYARHAAGNASANGYGESNGQLSSMKDGGFAGAISSPPFENQEGANAARKFKDPAAFARWKAQGYKNGKVKGHAASEEAILRSMEKANLEEYGDSPGQLGNMTGNFQAALSSPPYAQARIGQESGQGQCGHGDQYGETDGQLGAMDAEGFDAAVSSPPYCAKDDRRVPWGETVGKTLEDMDEERGYKRDNSFRGYYSTDPRNLGNPTGADQSDFWLAARAIVEQVYMALAPGGHAVWVVKNYVKSKEIVNFTDQWRQLCEAVGFVTLHEHRAMLVHKKGAQHTLDGGIVEKKTESKSFFRRLAEKNGSPRIDWESVLCMEKPS